MPAVSYDLAIEQGATFTVSFEWREDDGSTPPAGPLIDTTNYAAYMQIRTKPGSAGEVIASLDASSGLTVAGGVVTLRIGADVTELISRNGVYDIELHNTYDPTDVVRLVQGKVSCSPDVTLLPEQAP